jgi:hypothetical protein
VVTRRWSYPPKGGQAKAPSPNAMGETNSSLLMYSAFFATDIFISYTFKVMFSKTGRMFAFGYSVSQTRFNANI